MAALRGTHLGETEVIQGYGEFLHGRDKSRPYKYIGRGWYHLTDSTPRPVGAQFIAPVFRDIEHSDDHGPQNGPKSTKFLRRA